MKGTRKNRRGGVAPPPRSTAPRSTAPLSIPPPFNTPHDDIPSAPRSSAMDETALNLRSLLGTSWSRGRQTIQPERYPYVIDQIFQTILDVEKMAEIYYEGNLDTFFINTIIPPLQEMVQSPDGGYEAMEQISNHLTTSERTVEEIQNVNPDAAQVFERNYNRIAQMLQDLSHTGGKYSKKKTSTRKKKHRKSKKSRKSKKIHRKKSRRTRRR
jgi:hypothetical protein